MSQIETAERPATSRDGPSAPGAPEAPTGLHALAPERLPFAPSLEIRAFLLERERGNLLIYSTGGLDLAAPPIPELGGVARQYLNHGHEASFLPDAPGPELFLHEADRASVGDRGRVRASFSRRHALDGDFEVIPTPGHTPGATAYLWESDGHRILFTGDTLYLHRGEWRAAVLDSSDRAAYLESLELIGGLDFDLLVPWAAGAGEPYLAATDRDDARRRIGAIIERIRGGDDR